MATRTSTGSGKLSVAANWDTGVPVDGDIAVVDVGDEIIFDVDQSAFATGVQLVINGTLTVAEDLRVSGDGNAIIGANAVTGLTRAFMTASDANGQATDTSVRSIFASIVDDGGGSWHIDLYKEVGRTTKIAHTGNIAGDGAAALTADNASGVGGSLTIANFASIAADTDIELSGYYYWKNGAGNVTFGASGVWKCGTSVDVPYPAHLKFAADLNGAREVTMTSRTGCVQWFCAEPTTHIIKLSGAEAAGQTELSVDTDITALTEYWYAGAEVRIDRVRKAGVDSELRTLASVAAGTITVSAGLTAVKESGSLVILIARNIRLIGQTGTGRCFYGGTSCSLRCEMRPASSAYGLYNCVGHTASIISGASPAVYYDYGCSIATISGCTKGISTSSATICGTISGCGNGIEASIGATVGLISGSTYALLRAMGASVDVIDWCNAGIYGSGSGCNVGTISNCTHGTYMSAGRLVGCVFSGNTNDATTGLMDMGDALTFRSYQHNGVAGDNRVWCGAGSGATDSSVVAPGFVDSFKLTMTNATYWTRMDDEITVYEGRPIVIVGQIKNGTTGLTGRARLELFEELAEDPLPFGGTPIEQDIAPDDTDWHEVRWLYTASKTTTLTIRFSAKHGSNNAWGAWRVEGGAHSPIGSPIIKGLGAL